MPRPAIVMYSKTTCPFCHEAAGLLKERGVVDFEQIQIDLEPGRRQEMLAKSGGRSTVPQIFIGDTHVGGCDDLFALDASGGLASLLEAN